jgi:hypothetical protein
MSINFLLGSGVSLNAGMPKTADITKAVLTGEWKGQEALRHSDSTYYLGQPNSDIPDLDTPRVLKFAAILRSEIDSYYRPWPKGETNYEDIYYVADQVRGSESGLLDNPAVGRFVEQLRPQLALLLAGNKEGRSEWSLCGLAEETCNYIRDLVWRLIVTIDSQAIDLDYLEFLADACADGDPVNIFTLNHDTLTEQLLVRCGIAACDGFGDRIDDVRTWEDGKLENDIGSPVRLVKLHGSVSWFEFLQGNRWITRIPEDWDVWHLKGPSGQYQIPNGGRPKFLAGTGNKPLEYQAGLFVELHQAFRLSLERGRRLVVIGYGFADAGINLRLSEWLRAHSDARMVVVHPKPADLKHDSSWKLKAFWDDLEKLGQIRFIPKRAEEVTWSDIKALANNPV